MNQSPKPESDYKSPIDRLIRFCLEQKLIVAVITLLIVAWGIAVAPFDWHMDWLPRNPVPVDAIPNVGENQQIVFTEWPGRSPQDVEDQITYPLTVSLLGVPGVKEVRSLSMFGASMVFLILDEKVEFYWSRSRILEKLGSLPADLLPDGVQPTLGPDATALGQIFWYTLEGRDPDGHPVGGWDLHELRRVQDWFVRYGLQSAEGISEVASIGGFVQEYQVDVDPMAMRTLEVGLNEVVEAVRRSNLDVGAGVTEINRVEYTLRGLGFLKSVEDIEQAVVRTGPNRIPIRVKDVATVVLGPADRRGALTVAGAEAVGGVVAVREGYNPLQAINNVKGRMEEIRPGLPARVVFDWSRTTPAAARAFSAAQGFEGFSGTEPDHRAWLGWLRSHPRELWPAGVTISQVSIVPFYDRTGLIKETLGTLNDALLQQILVTVLVVVVMVFHLRTSLLISIMLPMAVLMCFIAMKIFGVDSNVVALAGIAIAIGTIVDMGLIVCENILKHLDEADAGENRLEVVYRATREVGSAVLTAIATTVVSFLPVFTMTGAEGKMFGPLAYTKTFVLLASVIVALTLIPAAAHLVIAGRSGGHGALHRYRAGGQALLALALLVVALWRGWSLVWPIALVLLGVAVGRYFWDRLPDGLRRRGPWLTNVLAAVLVAWWLAVAWEPLGPERGMMRNLLFVVLLVGGLLGGFLLFRHFYESILRWCLAHKALFLALPVVMLTFGVLVWLGFSQVFGFIPALAGRVGLNEHRLRASAPWVRAAQAFPGLGREFMPALDEGAFLWMPTVMPHASIGEALEVMQYQDLAIASVPEVDTVVGKLGRADSALDPAPISMIETIINYKPEYILDEAGRRTTFRFDRRKGEFERDADGALIPDSSGRPYRQWREHIRSPDDIWQEIVRAAHIPGATSAPKLQPIETRLVMLQTGMRAPMGIKLRAPDLETLDRMGLELEGWLRQVPAIVPETVNAERVVGKPYLELAIDRARISRFGLTIEDVQEVISMALGGMTVTRTVEGRERYPVRIRYPRELRNDLEQLERVLVPTADGAQIPLKELVSIDYQRGPQMIRSEETFLTAYVTFGGQPGLAEVNVVEAAQNFLEQRIAAGELFIPPGVSYRFAGNYENQLRAARTLAVVLPMSLVVIFLILYLQFRSTLTTLIIFSGIAVAWAGGFIMIYLYGQEWFANFSVLGVNMRQLFQLHDINLSVAVWVGFLALFGIATDDGVVMSTYLQQRFGNEPADSIEQIRETTVAAGLRRVRPCLMTSATTILALLPLLTSTGRGSDIMIPMAIPSLGGMTLVMISMFTVPVLYCLVEEWRFKLAGKALCEARDSR